MYLSKIDRAGDPLSDHPIMTKSVSSEVKGLLEKETFKVILREDVPLDDNVLPGRFAMTIESNQGGKPEIKAKFAVGRHRDILNNLLNHSSQTLQPSSIHSILEIAAAHEFNFWTLEVRQAYLQSGFSLSREVFIYNTPVEFKLVPDECLQLLKPLYGLCKSGDLCHKTLDCHHQIDLCLKSFLTDPAPYYELNNGQLSILLGWYVDDMTEAVEMSFKENCLQTHSRLKISDDVSPPSSFSESSADFKKMKFQSS